MSTDQHRFNQVSEKIIGCSFEVVKTLGRDFVENIYANALANELERHALDAKREHAVKVRYKGDLIGEFFATFW